ncbi:MAG: hypothetical protein WCE94_11375 [Candidatus Methanoperedens sp.]
MTLVITRVCNLGIVMVADSAEMVKNKIEFNGSEGYRWERRETPYQKLFGVDGTKVGISMWGAADIGSLKTNKWVEKFIKNDIIGDISVCDIANKLALRLNQEFEKFDNGVANKRTGFHVAGFDTNKHGIPVPSFYHVHNGHYKATYFKKRYFEFSPVEEVFNSENKTPDKIKSFKILRGKWYAEVDDNNPPLRRFIAHPDYIDARDLTTGRTTWNGDFVILFELFKDAFEGKMSIQDIQEYTGFSIPPELSSQAFQSIIAIKNAISLSQLAKSVVSLIKIIEKIHLSNGFPHIGSPIRVLTISKEGKEKFYMI